MGLAFFRYLTLQQWSSCFVSTNWFTILLVSAAVTSVRGASAASVDGVSGSGRQVRRRAAALRHSLLGPDKSLLDDFVSDDDNGDDDYNDVDYDAPRIMITATRSLNRRGRPAKSQSLSRPSKAAVQLPKPATRVVLPSKSPVQSSKSAIQPGSSLLLCNCVAWPIFVTSLRVRHWFTCHPLCHGSQCCHHT